MQCSVIVPTYNSAGWIALTIERIINVMKAKSLDFEIILVNDGSTDDTLAVLVEKSRTNNSVKVINMVKNTGQQRATLTGLIEAKGEYILTIDDDMEYDPSDIVLLYDIIKSKQLDLVYGLPGGGKRGIVNRLLYGSYLLLLQYSGAKRKTSFRILKRDMATKVSQYKEMSPFNLDFFLAQKTSSIGYVDVQYFPNATSRYSLWGYFKLLFHLELLKRSKMS